MDPLIQALRNAGMFEARELFSYRDMACIACTCRAGRQAAAESPRFRRFRDMTRFAVAMVRPPACAEYNYPFNIVLCGARGGFVHRRYIAEILALFPGKIRMLRDTVRADVMQHAAKSDWTDCEKVCLDAQLDEIKAAVAARKR